MKRIGACGVEVLLVDLLCLCFGVMGWRVSLRTPARLMLLASASALTLFSKIALSQCDSLGVPIQYTWLVACFQTIGLSICVLPGVIRYIAAAMRAGRAVSRVDLALYFCNNYTGDCFPGHGSV